MPWEAILSNGEIIKQNEAEVSCWKNLAIRCQKENLKIRKLTFNGIEMNKESYIKHHFILYEAFIPNVLDGGKNQHLKIGVGGFMPDNSCRIKWFKVSGNPMIYTERVHDPNPMYRKYAIEKENATKAN